MCVCVRLLEPNKSSSRQAADLLFGARQVKLSVQPSPTPLPLPAEDDDVAAAADDDNGNVDDDKECPGLAPFHALPQSPSLSPLDSSCSDGVLST